MKKIIIKFAPLLLGVFLSVFILSAGYAAKYEDVDNVSGYLVLLQRTPNQVEVMTENKDRLKYLWTQETVFVDWQEKELSPEDFYRQFKDKGVFLFLDGKKMTRIAPAVF